jgi:tRNA (guanine-N7-)-methyltransferase
MGADVFTVDPEKIFKRRAPLEIEIGSGTGEFIVERARQMPECDFLAIELAGPVFNLLELRISLSAIPNLIPLRADARTVVNLLLPDFSADAFHIYFPDPWPKKRHSKHRLFTPAFVAGLSRTLSPSGMLYVATDVAPYAEHIFNLLEGSGFARSDAEVPGASRSSFAKKYLNTGRPIHSAAFSAPPANSAKNWPVQPVLDGQQASEV